MTKRRFSAYLYLLMASLIWGVAGPVIKFTLQDFSPPIFLIYRFFISSLIAVIIFYLHRFPIPKKPVALAKIVGYGFVTSTIALGLLFLGFDRVSALQASLLSALAPLFVVVGGALLLKEKISTFEKTGLMIALAGTLVPVIEPLLQGTSFLSASTEGNVLIVASVIAGAISTIWAKKLLAEGFHPDTLTHGTFIVGLVTLLPIALTMVSLSELVSTIVHAPLHAHLGVLYMGILSGTLAYTLVHIGEKDVEAGEAAIFNYLLPVWAAPLAIFWLHETISEIYLLSAVIILIGVGIAEYHRRTTHLASTRHKRK